MTEPSDTELVRACLHGDTQAFAVLVERYGFVLNNVAYRMTGDFEEARDITQTTFLRAWTKLETFDDRHRFFSWIYRIAVNTTLNAMKRRRVHEPLDSPRATGLTAPQATPEEAYERLEASERVQAALMELEPDQRQLVVLRHFADLSYRDIAEVLGIPEKTVKSRLFTARRKLCELLLHRSTPR